MYPTLYNFERPYERCGPYIRTSFLDMFSLSGSRFLLAWLRRRIIGRVVVAYMQVPRRPGERDDYTRLRENRSSPIAGLNEGGTPVN